MFIFDCVEKRNKKFNKKRIIVIIKVQKDIKEDNEFVIY